MRVTNKMLSNSYLNDMKANMANLRKIQQQLTTGKEIRKPSDDPFKVARTMQLHTNIETNKQYNENIKDTLNWLDTTDTVLGQAGNVFHRINELLVSCGDAGYGKSEKQAVKQEINEKVGELSQILNTNFDGKYLFSGSRGTYKPTKIEQEEITDTSGKVIGYNKKLKYDFRDPANKTNEENMLKQKLKVEISQGVSMDYNVSIADVMEFKNEKGDSLKLDEILSSIVNNIDKDNTKELITTDLQNAQDAFNNMLKLRSEIGAKQNRMESAGDKNKDENLNMTEILSKTEDIDITEKVMEFATMQTIYIASLQTSAKVLQPTLFDYMR
jgi:flagellar hook-associated protein 3 FlgL